MPLITINIFCCIPVPVHFEYHDVDEEFLAGMIEELAVKYVGNAKLKVPMAMQYPPAVSYGLMDKYLSDAVKRIRLRSTFHLKRVEKYLNALDREVIPTDGGYNNLLKAIKMQLHVPKHFTENMLRHQLSSYLIERVDFFYPKMEEYLKSNGLTYTSYVIGVYNGRIWGDKFLIGALGMMFNVRITVISPYFSDVWNVYHDGRRNPDIVLVCNGAEFGTGRDNITHFTSTKGKGGSWECVGKGRAVDEIGLYSGYSEGRRTAIDLFSITVNRELLFKTNTILNDINKLCRDVKGICIRRDEMLQKLSEVKITLGDFKRLTSYFVEDENVKERNLMPVKERTVEIVPSFSRAIPKIRVKDSRTTEFGKQLVDEALEMINEHTSSREEEVSCHEEPSTSECNKHQHFEHQDITTDCDQLVNESLQATDRKIAQLRRTMQIMKMKSITGNRKNETVKVETRTLARKSLNQMMNAEREKARSQHQNLMHVYTSINQLLVPNSLTM